MGVKPKRSAVVRNGIAATASGGAVTRTSIGLADDDVVLMSVGTLEPRKNQGALVERFAALPGPPGSAGGESRPLKRAGRVVLVLVGEGPDRAKIERRAAELNILDRLVLLGHRTDVPALLPLADVYVHAALAENCPVAVIEAARAGLPWAAVPAAGMVELQRHLGGCVPLDELAPLLADADRRQQLGRAAAANFAAGFTREAMVRGYLDALGIATG